MENLIKQKWLFSGNGSAPSPEGDSLSNAVIRGKYGLHANKFRMVIYMSLITSMFLKSIFLSFFIFVLD